MKDKNNKKNDTDDRQTTIVDKGILNIKDSKQKQKRLKEYIVIIENGYDGY